jgi:hypothetical protein
MPVGQEQTGSTNGRLVEIVVLLWIQLTTYIAYLQDGCIEVSLVGLETTG